MLGARVGRDQRSVPLWSQNTATVEIVQRLQLSLRQPVRVTFDLFPQRKDDVDDVDEVDDALIAHDGLNDRRSVSLIVHDKER